MTDYEDDSDGELPSISLSQSSGVKTEFSMPPATELVAQREREAAAELELQKLRDAETAAAEVAAAAAEAAARRRDDAGEMLSSGVTALEVSGSSFEDTQRQVEELAAMAAHLPAQDAVFLTAYARALQDAPSQAAATAITNQVVGGVCSGARRGAWPAGAAGACGAAAALLTVPPAPRARRALHALLDQVASPQQVESVIVASRAALRSAARRLEAHDAARSGAGGGGDRLAGALLAAAVHEIVEGRSGPEPSAPLSAGVAAAARARWRRLPAPRQLLLLRCAARALAAAGSGAEGGELLAALAQPLPRAPPRTQLEAESAGAAPPLRHQVLANVAKLQLLFGLGRRAAAVGRQMDESREREEVNTEQETNVNEKPPLDQDMIVKKELENKTAPTTELEPDDLTTRAEGENEVVAQMAPGHEVPMEQESADAGAPAGGLEAGEGEAMEVEAGSPRPGPRRQHPPARRSPRLAARPQPDNT